MSVLTIELQADGKIVTGGSFAVINSQAHPYIARLKDDGTVDTNFNPLPHNTIDNILIQPDGKTLASGNFTGIDGQRRNKVARSRANSSLDQFNTGSGAYFTIYILARQSDGKILPVGSFTTFNGQPRNRIARLYENGALDATLNSNAQARGCFNRCNAD